MQKGLFAATLLAALTLVGVDSQEAQAGTPFQLSIGGPRGGLSIGTGYGFGRGYGGGFYGPGRVVPRGFAVGYRGFAPLPPPRVRYHQHYVVPRRSCDYGYGGYGYYGY